MRNRNSNSTILNMESGHGWWKKRYAEERNRVVEDMKIVESKERNKKCTHLGRKMKILEKIANGILWLIKPHIIIVRNKQEAGFWFSNGAKYVGAIKNKKPLNQLKGEKNEH